MRRSGIMANNTNNNNNGQSLINSYNTNTGRNNTSSNNLEIKLNSVAESLGDVASKLNNLVNSTKELQKDLKDSNKSKNNSESELTKSIDKLVHAMRTNTSTQNGNTGSGAVNSKIIENRQLSTEIGKLLIDVERKINSINVTYTQEEANRKNQLIEQWKFLRQYRESLDAQLNNLNDLENLTDAELQLRNRYINSIETSYDKFVSDINQLDSGFADKLQGIQLKIANIDKELATANSTTRTRLMSAKQELEDLKKLEQLRYKVQREGIEREQLLNQNKQRFSRELEIGIESLSAKNNQLSNLIGSTSNRTTANDLNEIARERQRLITDAIDTGNLDSGRAQILDELQGAVLAGNQELIRQYRQQLEETHTSLPVNNSINDDSNSNLDRNAFTREWDRTAESQFSTHNLTSRKNELKERQKENSNSIDIILARLSTDPNLTDEQRANLDLQRTYLEEENNAIDNQIDAISNLAEAIFLGDSRRIKEEFKKLRKQGNILEQSERNNKSFLDNTLSSLKQMQEAYRPTGFIAKTLSKAVTLATDRLINYQFDLQTNALNSLQQSYASAGMSIAQTNLVTRDDVASLMGDVGAELAKEGLSGVNTTEVMSTAESLANAGIWDDEKLKDFSMIITKASKLNPHSKDQYTDEENIRLYDSIYRQAEAAGKDGAQALEDYIMKEAQEVWSATDAVGNAFWEVNGKLTDLNHTITSASNSFGLTSEQTDEFRKSMYATAAVVGTTSIDFNQFANNLFSAQKTGFADSAFNVISDSVTRDKLQEALESGNTTEFLKTAYANVLNMGNGLDNKSRAALANSLGLNFEELQKIRNESEYQDENGNFVLDKFLSKIDDTKATIDSGEGFDEKEYQMLYAGEMQTIEQSDETRAINNMSENFEKLIHSDVREAVNMEIDAINMVRDTTLQATHWATETLIGSLENLLMGNTFMSGMGSLQGMGSLGAGASAGGMGALAAGGTVLAAGAAGVAVGTALRKYVSWDGKSLGEHVDDFYYYLREHGETEDEFYENLNSDYELLQSNISDATDALSTLTTAMDANTSALGQETSNLVNSDDYQSNLARYTGAVKSSIRDDGFVANGRASSDVTNLAQQLAGAAGLSDMPSTFWDDVAVPYLYESGLNEKQVNAIKGNYDIQYGIMDQWKQEYDEFTEQNGEALYTIYKNAKDAQQTARDSGIELSWSNAWNDSFNNYVKSADLGPMHPLLLNKHYIADNVPYAPVEGENGDFVIEGNKFILNPGAHNEGNETKGDMFAFQLNKHTGFYATGLERVPYDNFPAILHKNERVQTAAEVKYSNLLSRDLVNEIITTNKLIQELQPYLNTDNSNIVAETLINTVEDMVNNGSVEITNSTDITPIVNAVDNQSSDISNLISNVLEILNTIAINTGKTFSTYTGSYLAKAIENKSRNTNDYKNPAIY